MTAVADFLGVQRPSIPIPSGVLKGPADADHYRMKVGRYRERWYIDPLPGCDIAPASPDGQAWPSFSHIKKASGKDWTYTSFERIAHAMDTEDLKPLPVGRRLARMNEINKSDMDYAMQRGTNVHTYLEMALRGKCDPTYVDGPHEPGADYLSAVKDFLDCYQPELVAAEFVYIGRDLNGMGYGGTADCLVRIDGKVYDVDWKSRKPTSDHGCYAEEAAQLAASGSADYWIVEGDAGPQRQRVPEIDGGLIVSIKPDGVRLYPVDITKATPYFRSLHAFWVAQKNERDGIGRQMAPRKRGAVPAAMSLTDAIAAARSADELTALWAEHKDAWTAEHTALARERKAAL